MQPQAVVRVGTMQEANNRTQNANITQTNVKNKM